MLTRQSAELGGKSYAAARRDLDEQISSIKTISSQKNQEQRRIASLEAELAHLEALVAHSQTTISTTTSMTCMFLRHLSFVLSPEQVSKLLETKINESTMAEKMHAWYVAATQAISSVGGIHLQHLEGNLAAFEFRDSIDKTHLLCVRLGDSASSVISATLDGKDFFPAFEVRAGK